MATRLKSMVEIGLSPEILLMVSKVYIPVLFPLTFLIGWTAISLDALLGLESGFLPTPLHFVAAAASFVFGAGLWLWTYTDLVGLGEGSPSPTAGRTRKLVVRGVYARCRNPSVWGKLFGVFAVGLAVNSFSFCFILLPPILAISLIEKVVRQEPQLVEVFGEDYLEYRRHVPLFVPRLTPWRQGPSAIEAAERTAEAVHSDTQATPDSDLDRKPGVRS